MFVDKKFVKTVPFYVHPFDELYRQLSSRLHSPRRPSDLPAENFRLALSHMLTEEIINMEAAGENRFGIKFIDSEVVGVRETGARQCDYLIRHTILLEADQDERLLSQQQVQIFLREALGVTPRQREGPWWNIIALAVRPDTA